MPFFFQNSNWNIVKIRVKGQKKTDFRQMNNFDLILTFDLNFDRVPIGISKKEKYFLLTVFCKDSESAIRIAKFSF